MNEQIRQFLTPEKVQELVTHLGGRTAQRYEDLFANSQEFREAFDALKIFEWNSYELEGTTEVSSRERLFHGRGQHLIAFIGEERTIAEISTDIDGNATISDLYEGHITTQRVIPLDAGFINHTWTAQDAVLPAQVVDLLNKAIMTALRSHDNSQLEQLGVTFDEAQFLVHHTGHFATEDIFVGRMLRMLEHAGDQEVAARYRPIRIGFLLIEEGSLQAIAKIKANRPELFEKNYESTGSLAIKSSNFETPLAPSIDTLRQDAMNLDATVIDIVSKLNLVGFHEGITHEFWANAGQEGFIVPPHDKSSVYSYSPGEAEMRSFLEKVKQRLQEHLGQDYVITIQEDYQFGAIIFYFNVDIDYS